MKALYHNGDVVLVLSCTQLNLTLYELSQMEERALYNIGTHESLAKAHKDKEQKKIHRNAARRAVTRHKRLKKLIGDINDAYKEALR